MRRTPILGIFFLGHLLASPSVCAQGEVFVSFEVSVLVRSTTPTLPNVLVSAEVSILRDGGRRTLGSPVVSVLQEKPRIFVSAEVSLCDGTPETPADDCDGNGIADVCELGTGDFDGNGILDICEGLHVDFRRGDVGSPGGTLDIADAIALLSVLFGTTPTGQPSTVQDFGECPEAFDANADGVVNLLDPLGVLAYLFSSGPDLPPPFQACGIAPELTPLTCSSYTLGCP